LALLLFDYQQLSIFVFYPNLMKPNKLIVALAILMGLSIAGYLVGSAIQRFQKEDRVISVKGFAEHEVKSNFAVWTIKNKIATNNLAEGSKLMDETRVRLIDFLLQNGIKKAEIVQKRLNVTDKMAREYTDNNSSGFRYLIENVMQVRSKDVETVNIVSKQTDKLLKMGIVLAEEQVYDPTVQYSYTNLNEIKPKMLSEAIKNAKKAAEQFTQDSQVTLGKLKSANQGLFTIVDRDIADSSPNPNNGEAGNGTDIYKKVRVVINASFSVE
jgi:hypothetical protein